MVLAVTAHMRGTHCVPQLHRAQVVMPCLFGECHTPNWPVPWMIASMQHSLPEGGCRQGLVCTLNHDADWQKLAQLLSGFASWV